MTFWIIFLVLLALLLTLVFWGLAKDRRKKKKTYFKKRELEENTSNYRAMLFFKLTLLLDSVDDEVKNFDKFSDISFSDINSFANKKIDEIKNSIELKKASKIVEYSEEFSLIFINLAKTKPVNWKKDGYIAYNIIHAKTNVLIKRFPKLWEETKKEFKWI